MDSRWFKEDRDQYKDAELQKAKEESQKALKNSTFMARRLRRILNEEYEACLAQEEDMSVDFLGNYAQKILVLHARRKCLKDIIKLLPE